jgi:23S rRNA pseudouridine1911/1915/1917 synthase
MLQNIRIPESDLRLDRCLADLLPDRSRSFVQKLLAEGRATLNGRILKPSWKTVAGSVIALDIPEPEATLIQPQDIPLDIVYEDEWLIVVNKAQGMVVHPAAGHRDQTLVNALLQHCAGNLSDINGVIRPGIVHRIDKDTSGLLLVVKDNRVHADISEKIRRHEIKRIYQALVHGHVSAATGTIDAPVGRDPRHRQRMAVVADGKPALSHFQTIRAADRASWLEVSLETGRTHQIRVHLQYIGHPVIGDPLYAGNRPRYDLSGQALHAGTLSLTHPVTGEAMTLSCPVPDTFTRIAEQLL